MNILLISGHGAGDPGATGYIDGVQYVEADEARRVTASLRSILSKSINVDVYPTERNAFYDCTNGLLTSYANISAYDYVLEIHFNAFAASSSDGQTKGIECYVPSAEPGIVVEQLICSNVSNLGLKNRGVKHFDWSVIYNVRQFGVSAALLEVCFIDDPDDMRVYENNFNSIIEEIANGILEGFGVESIKMDSTEGTEGDDEMIVYEKLEDIPEWGRKTVDKLLDKKYLVGTDGESLNIEQHMLRTLVINDRAGLYDN